MIKIENKIYYITFNLCEDAIYVELFGIKPKYRGRKYSYRIFNNLKKKFSNKPIYLNCFITLINFYKKLGFIETNNYTDDGYFEMLLK